MLILLASSAKPPKAGIFATYSVVYLTNLQLFSRRFTYYQDYLIDFVEFAQDGRQILGQQIGETMTSVLAEKLVGDRKWLDADTYTTDVKEKYLLSPMQLATRVKKAVSGDRLLQLA